MTQQNNQQILLPIIKQLTPTLLASSILGVQPMSSDVGEIFTKKFKVAQPAANKYKFSRAKWYYADHHYDEYYDVMAWCKEQFGPRPKRPDAWTRWCDVHIDRIRFRDEKDYLLFLLRWGG